MDVRNVVERALWTAVQALAASTAVFATDLAGTVEGAGVATVAAITAVATAASVVKTLAQERLRTKE